MCMTQLHSPYIHPLMGEVRTSCHERSKEWRRSAPACGHPHAAAVLLQHLGSPVAGDDLPPVYLCKIASPRDHLMRTAHE
jgi:hypothetical protein